MILDPTVLDVDLDEMIEMLYNQYGTDAGADDCSGNFYWDEK